LVNFGILPLVLANPADYERIHQGSKLSFPKIRKTIAAGAAEIPVVLEGKQIITILDVSQRQRKILLAGGILNQAKQKN
jgi:aconitate hydratase